MLNSVEVDILEFLQRRPDLTYSMAEICSEFQKRNAGVIQASVKALVESGHLWSEGSPLKYSLNLRCF